MKQGEAKTIIGGTKTEPVAKAVSPAYAAGIGVQEIRTKHIPIYEGRGLKAPMVGQTNHKCGSQGKH